MKQLGFRAALAHFVQHARACVAATNKGEPVPDATVNCGGCTACCYMDDLQLSQAEGDSGTYLMDNEGRLLKKADGGCVYLVDGGCGIYDRRPEVCRGFDCRIAMLLPGRGLPGVLNAARARVAPPETKADLAAVLAVTAMHMRAVTATNNNNAQAVLFALMTAPTRLKAAREVIGHMDVEQVRRLLKNSKDMRGYK